MKESLLYLEDFLKLCFDVLNNSVDKYNNTYHRTIKIKQVDVKPDSYAEYRALSNEKDPKFKVGDYLRF